MRSYAPGLVCEPYGCFTRFRPVPQHGSIVSRDGDRVVADSVVGYFNPQGNMTNHCLARELDISPFDVPSAMLRKEGDRVMKGEIIARARGLFNRKEFAAPEDSVLERISPYTGWITLRGQPLPILAEYPGTVARSIAGQGVYIDCRGALVQGIFGVGGRASGRLELSQAGPESVLTPEHAIPEYEGAVVVGGARASLGFLDRARRLGYKAVVTGGVHKVDLDAYLGYTLGIAVTGLEPTMILIITEGFGHIPMRAEVLAALAPLVHKQAYVCGATQVRAGVIRPELFVPYDQQSSELAASGVFPNLAPGMRVRLIRAPLFGKVGIVLSGPTQMRLPTENTAMAVVVRLGDGEERVVPTANLEPVGVRNG